MRGFSLKPAPTREPFKRFLAAALHKKLKSQQRQLVDDSDPAYAKRNAGATEYHQRQLVGFYGVL
jgi:hypothetical protein